MVSWSDNVGLTTHRVANVPGLIIRINATQKNKLEAFLFGCVLQMSALFGLEVCLTAALVFCKIQVYI